VLWNIDFPAWLHAEKVCPKCAHQIEPMCANPRQSATFYSFLPCGLELWQGAEIKREEADLEILCSLTLDQHIGVRIPGGQPANSFIINNSQLRYCGRGFFAVIKPVMHGAADVARSSINAKSLVLRKSNWPDSWWPAKPGWPGQQPEKPPQLP